HPARPAIVDRLLLGDASPGERGVVVRRRSEGDRRRTYLRLVPQSLAGLLPVALRSRWPTGTGSTWDEPRPATYSRRYAPTTWSWPSATPHMNNSPTSPTASNGWHPPCIPRE
ncbi:hypothetical protein, partial [Nonomuraea rhizosphaerae]|uniref:hypothetical protein n=1 Tax=Nonomuraea rhizosphaerae TaxID=2665663 RepID=UPI003FD6F231